MSAARSSERVPASRGRRSRVLLGDVVAGTSVAMVGVPQSLAYAELAGMDPVVGLYAGAVPPILAAIFASSPYLQTGPVAITSLLTFGALSSVATPGSPEYLGLGLALALVVGIVRLTLGLLRAGWLAYLMSQPMLLGFVPAAAVLIAGSQTSKALGVPPPPFENEILDGIWSLVHPGSWSLAAVIVTVATAVLILGGRRLHVLFPGVLVAAVLAIAASAAGFYPGPVVDSIPSGFPPFTLLSHTVVRPAHDPAVRGDHLVDRIHRGRLHLAPLRIRGPGTLERRP